VLGLHNIDHSQLDALVKTVITLNGYCPSASSADIHTVPNKISRKIKSSFGKRAEKEQFIRTVEDKKWTSKAV
jgi:hypothetical protein